MCRSAAITCVKFNVKFQYVLEATNYNSNDHKQQQQKQIQQIIIKSFKMRLIPITNIISNLDIQFFFFLIYLFDICFNTTESAIFSLAGIASSLQLHRCNLINAQMNKLRKRASFMHGHQIIYPKTYRYFAID